MMMHASSKARSDFFGLRTGRPRYSPAPQHTGMKHSMAFGYEDETRGVVRPERP